MYIHATNINIVFLKCKFLAEILREGISPGNILSQFCGNKFPRYIWALQFCRKKFPREICCRSFAGRNFPSTFCRRSFAGRDFPGKCVAAILRLENVLFISARYQFRACTTVLSFTVTIILWGKRFFWGQKKVYQCISINFFFQNRSLIISWYKPFVSVLHLLLCVQIR